MNDHITNLPCRLAACATGPIARWQRRMPGRLAAGDTFARQAGWTITRIRFGGRIYRDPWFGQLSGARAPGIRMEAAGPLRPPPAPGALPAPSTRPPSALVVRMARQGRSR
jgi:hypothetical protein